MKKKGDFFKSTFLNATDVHGQGDIGMKIQSLQDEEVGRGADARQAAVMYFSKSTVPGLETKRMVVNSTNWDRIALYLKQDDADQWAGRVIFLHEEFCTNPQGKTVPCVRVSMNPVKPVAPAAPAAQDAAAPIDTAVPSAAPANSATEMEF